MACGEANIFPELSSGGHMNTLVIQGSPRKDGNTATISHQVMEGLAAAGDGTLNEFWLNDMTIHPCQACFSCFKTGQCSQQDDMQALYPHFYQADIVVFAVPIYWWHRNAQMKLCFDRMTALLSRDDKLSALAGKQIVLVTAYNYPNCALCTLKMFEEFQDWIGVNLSVIEHCARDGHITAFPEKLAAAYQLGIQLRACF
jgi:multimeric flavodoxin WrbA